MKIALLGFGTVGKGVYEILNRKDTNDTAQIEIAHILIRKGKEKKLPIMVEDYDQILQDPQCECIVEVMGGIEPAHTYIMKALQAKKHVVTANKAVVAAHYQEFIETAQKQQVQFRFEASCGGGIPWIHSLLQAKRIDLIQRISGIFNGTANYIIDQMVKKDLEFAVALKEAQDAGYAEADPSADIDGIDTANKAMISASLAFDIVCTRDFPISGIRHLTKQDLHHFLQHGYSIRLLMHACMQKDRYACVVEPTLIKTDTLEANIPDNYNLTSLYGETLGDLKIYGQGAGALPTGNAIVSDVIAIQHKEVPDPVVLTHKTFDTSLLKGDYILRKDKQYQTYHAVDPLWMHEIYREILQEDPAAFLARISTKGEMQ